MTNRRARSANGAIRILVADADTMSLRLIAGRLNGRQKHLQVVAVASDVKGALRGLHRHRPDVALLNAGLQDAPDSGYRVLGDLTSVSPKTAAIMLIPESERALVLKALRGGARGVFVRSQPFSLLAKCVYAVHGGQIWVGNRELEYLLEAFRQLKPLHLVAEGSIPALSRREGQVVGLLADGLTNRDISQELHVTEHTVRNYVYHIYEKLGVSTRVELALYAVSRRENRPRQFEHN